MKKDELLSIGEMSKLTSLGPKTLKYYEKIGLLDPFFIDPESKYRYYNKGQLYQVILIKKYKIRGFSLKEIKSILIAHNPHEIMNIYHKKLVDFEKGLKRLQILKKEFQERIGVLESLITPPVVAPEQGIQFQELPARWIIFIRSVAPFNHFIISTRWLEMQKYVTENQLDISDNYLHIIYDNYTKLLSEPLDHEHAILLNSKPEKELPFIRPIPKGLFATRTVSGTYENSLAAFHQMMSHINKSGFEAEGPVIRLFLTPYLLKAEPGYYSTQFQIPVRKK